MFHYVFLYYFRISVVRGSVGRNVAKGETEERKPLPLLFLFLRSLAEESRFLPKYTRSLLSDAPVLFAPRCKSLFLLVCVDFILKNKCIDLLLSCDKEREKQRKYKPLAQQWCR